MTETLPMTSPVRYDVESPEIFKAMIAASQTITEGDLDPLLKHLVKLRASQINGCVFCIDMHLREARHDGETNDRLDKLVVWDHVPNFTPAEKAALAWTEALTVVDRKTDYATLRGNLREYFNDKEITVLTATIGLINFWNRMQVSRH